MHSELNMRDTTNQLLDDQINQANIDLANKKQQIFNARMDIINSQGQEFWTPQTLNSNQAETDPNNRKLF